MSGINNIIEMIESKSDEKAQSIIREAESQKKRILEDAEQKAKGIEKTLIQKAELESKSAIARQEASAKLKSKYKILESKEALLKQTLEEAEESLRKETKGKDYGTIMTDLAVSGGITLNEDKVELVVPKGHESQLDAAAISKAISSATGLKVSATVSKENVRASGGVIIRNMDRTRWVDNTFDARMERLEKKIRDEISTILFSENE
ncbi:MAG: V-type ATP synthase subunit E family protein [Candidatus Thorarchaeota archaeon]|nr:V-type ATP synthase subunit E family protein [Candidatus Thorarchaeota archaeon]